MRYRFRLDGAGLFPDPASRFQPEGPHAASEVIDPSTFPWSDAHWPGVSLEGQVIYEMHIGTFTPEGTWQAARRELARTCRSSASPCSKSCRSPISPAASAGATTACCCSPRSAIYGRPGRFPRFVNEAHRLGIGVILDVVYNHIGPDGNYLGEFSEDYFTNRYDNEWGEALNFDGENSGRCASWSLPTPPTGLEEYHLDGLRLDATQQIFDSSPATHHRPSSPKSMRAAAGERKVFIVAENEAQESSLARPRCAGRLWPRRPVERRFSSHRARRADRPATRPTTPITPASRRS